jgi:hypothetical protein
VATEAVRWRIQVYVEPVSKLADQLLDPHAASFTRPLPLAPRLLR